MPEVAQEERQPTVTGSLGVRRCLRIGLTEPLRVSKSHNAVERLRRLRRERTASLADRNGP